MYELDHMSFKGQYDFGGRNIVCGMEGTLFNFAICFVSNLQSSTIASAIFVGTCVSSLHLALLGVSGSFMGGNIRLWCNGWEPVGRRSESGWASIGDLRNV